MNHFSFISWLTVVLTCSVSAASANAQDEPVERLRAQVAAAPEDASLRCQFSFALVGVGRFEEARQEATEGIAAIARPLTTATRRLMGACLYNRGRAHEGLSATREAVTDYVASLSLRGNETVRARLDSLVPDVPRGLPAAALAVFVGPCLGETFLRRGQTPVSVRAGDITWHFVTATACGGTLTVYALTTRDEGQVSIATVDAWSQEDSEAPIEVESARAHASLRGIGGVVATIRAVGGGTCGQMDGYMDFEHHATVFVALVGGAVRSRAIVTRQSDCGEHVSAGLRIRGDSVVITRPRGGDISAGSHVIESLLR